MISLDVTGTPAPKGSTRAILISGRAVNVPGGSNVNRTALRSWAAEVAHQAQAAMRGHELLVGLALVVELTFRLVRPQGHYGAHGLRPNAPPAPHVKPDLDKLVRGTLDPLEGIVFDGDSRIVQIMARKIYAVGGHAPGCRIQIGTLAETGWR